MFLSQRSAVSLSKTVHSSLEHVLAALHDPVLLIDLGPLVAGHTIDPSDPDLYHITDKLTVLGYFHTETKFTAKFTRKEDGVISYVRAGLGTVIYTNWTARSTSEGIEILEECSVQGFFLTVPYIVTTIKASHIEFLDKLAEKLENQTNG